MVSPRCVISSVFSDTFAYDELPELTGIEKIRKHGLNDIPR